MPQFEKGTLTGDRPAKASFWYAFFYEMLPSPRQALNPIVGVFLCNRGLIFAVPAAHPVHGYMGLALLGSLAFIIWLRRWARKRQDQTGRPFPVFKASIGIVIGLPLMTWILGGNGNEHSGVQGI